MWLIILQSLELYYKSSNFFSEEKNEDKVDNWKLYSVEKMEQNHTIPDTHRMGIITLEKQIQREC